MALLYIVSEHPSVSETFVVNEAAALAALGVPVVGYALKRGEAGRAAAALELVCQPPSRPRLALCAVKHVRLIARRLWSVRRQRLPLRELSRLAFASAHAAHASRACTAHDVDHVHAHFLGRSADVAGVLAQLLGCRWTATAHGADIYAPWEPGLLQQRLRDVSAVACANQGVRQQVVSRGGALAPPTEIVHCGVDTASLAFHPPPRGAGDRYLITVGRLIATKGYWTILEAASSLLRRDADLKWLVVGHGPLFEPLRADPRSVALASQLRFLGALDHQAAVDLIAGAAGFVLPCEIGRRGESDGIPVALMEAMALGIPVVTTPIGGIRELVVDRVTGFLTAPRDAASLTQALDALLYADAAEAIAAVCENARRKVEREFDLATEAQAMLSFLQPYIALGNGRHHED